MSLPIAQQVDTFRHPAAIVSEGGEVLAANPLAEPLLTPLLENHTGFYPALEGEGPFTLYLDTGLQVKGTYLPEVPGFLLEWLTLSPAELRLALFQAVARSVNSSLILEEIFDALGEVLRSFIAFDSGTIVILDETQNSTKVVVFLDAEGQAEIRGDNKIFSGYDQVIDELVRRPQARILSCQLHPSILVNNTSHHALVVPLVSKGVVIGGIGLSGQNYTENQLQLLVEVSEQLAVAVENARLYWQTQSQAGREFLINQITKSIRQSLDIPEILETTVQEVGKVMGLSRCLIHYWGNPAERLEHFEYVPPGIPQLSEVTAFAEFERDLFQRRAATPQQYNPFILNDSRTYAPGFSLLEAEGIKSLAVFPILLAENRFVGTISLHQCDTYRAWLGEEIELLKAIAEHLVVALHQAHLFGEKENQRKQLEDTLKELRQTQMQLIQSEKMAVLGQFVAGIAHEVNTPLGTLMANDDTVTRCLEQLAVGDEKSEKYRRSALDLLGINRLAGERIQEIVRNLRNFARLDESDLKKADLHEGLESTLVLMQSAFKDRIQLERVYGTLPLVDCFPGLLNQVFMNLLVNACQSIDGKGVIRLITEYDADSQQVRVTVADSGKGIQPEHLGRIFDPGFTTKGVGVGTGLGLALCYKIVEKHHGYIEVESVVGQGTRMTVILPATQPQAHP